jgi:hypothetical protein
VATIKNATEFCQLVENRLGWVPADNTVVSHRRRYMREAGKVNRRIKTDPDLFTWDNLELAVELLFRERLARSPLGVMAHVPRAVAMRRETEGDLEQNIRDAVAYEVGRGDPQGWETRFARATGIFRAQALAEWKASIR